MSGATTTKCVNVRDIFVLTRRNFLFWLSRKIDYPLLPPDMLQVNFTCRCNLRCKMCGMHNHRETLKKNGKKTEIDSDTLRKVITESAEMGIKDMLFVGGEPFVREDLFDLVIFAKNSGFNVTILTNGTLLDAETIERCFSSMVNCLNISIDAAKDVTFCKIRGENVFDAITKNIADLIFSRNKKNSYLPRITATCTIMNDNLEELSDVVFLCRELNIDQIYFQPVVTSSVNPAIRDFRSSVFIPPSRFALLDKSIDKLVNYKIDNPDFILNEVEHLGLIKKYFRSELHSKSPVSCYIGYNRLQVSQDYVLSFCIPQDKRYEGSFGDVGQASLKELWYSKDAKIRRRLIKRCNSPCLQSCSYRQDFVRLVEMIKG